MVKWRADSQCFVAAELAQKLSPSLGPADTRDREERNEHASYPCLPPHSASLIQVKGEAHLVTEVHPHYPDRKAGALPASTE